jgi:hypothetical protein
LINAPTRVPGITVPPGPAGSMPIRFGLFALVQLYEAPLVPVMLIVNCEPEQVVIVPETEMVGVALTVTFVVPAGPVQPFTVAVTEYVPDAKVVAFGIEGFCEFDVKLFGPVQLYVAPPIFEAVRFKVDPAQIALLLPAVGAAGAELTVTLVVPAGPVQPLTVAATE